MAITAEEAAGVRDLVKSMDAEGGAVVVEGRRDSEALRRLGYRGTILEFHRSGGLAVFADRAAAHGTLIMLLDRDRKGRYLTRRIIRLLQRRARIDMSFGRRLAAITCGRIKFTEQLACYEA